MNTRQRARRVLITAMFFLLPVTLYYMSPVLSLQGAAFGVVGGAVVVFGLQFLSSLFVGRLFCGWICPAGGGQELVLGLRRRRVGQRWGFVKWVIWVPWVLVLAFLFVRAGGVRRVDFLYQTRYGISVTDLPGAIAYVSVVAVFLILALTVGRRGGCHAICWMAPFMVLGRSVRNVLAWPSLRLEGDAAACTACGSCTKACPMSIDVTARVKAGRLETPDCILCGSCVDGCTRRAVRYSFSGGRQEMKLTWIVLATALAAMPEGEASAEGLDPATAARLDAALADAARALGVCGLQACVLTPGGRWCGAAGTVDRQGREPASSEDLFRVGSVTKTFTASLVLRMVEEGRLGLDWTLDRWYPDFPRSATTTVRDLLAHTSGVPEVLAVPRFLMASALFPRRDWDVDDVLHDMAGAPASRGSSPGTFSYSNTNYLLLGRIVEKVSGHSLADLLSGLCEQLGLRSTRFFAAGDPPARLRSGFDRSLVPFPGGYVHRPDAVSWSSLAGASGALVSNARDLALFLRAFFAGHVVGNGSVAAMTDFASLRWPENPYITGVGLGLFRFELDGREYWGHEGLMVGSQSVALHSPESVITLAVVGNASRFDVVSVARALVRAVAAPDKGPAEAAGGLPAGVADPGEGGRFHAG